MIQWCSPHRLGGKKVQSMKANPLGLDRYRYGVGGTSGRNPWIFEDAYPTWPSFSTIKTSLYIYIHILPPVELY